MEEILYAFVRKSCARNRSPKFYCTQLVLAWIFNIRPLSDVILVTTWADVREWASCVRVFVVRWFVCPWVMWWISFWYEFPCMFAYVWVCVFDVIKFVSQPEWAEWWVSFCQAMLCSTLFFYKRARKFRPRLDDLNILAIWASIVPKLFLVNIENTYDFEPRYSYKIVLIKKRV